MDKCKDCLCIDCENEFRTIKEDCGCKTCIIERDGDSVGWCRLYWDKVQLSVNGKQESMF